MKASVPKKVFVSSTSRDLQDHRKAVLDAIHTQGELADAMEYFQADPDAPVARCLEKARSADALVLIVAFCYGWIPDEDEGGDGTSSITWLETRAAIGAGVPVFAFAADETLRRSWAYGRDTDDFYLEDADGIALAKRRVEGLRAFRRDIDAKWIRSTFGAPPDLANKVTASLFRWMKDGWVPLSPLGDRIFQILLELGSTDLDHLQEKLGELASPLPRPAPTDVERAVDSLVKRGLAQKIPGVGQVRVTDQGKKIGR